MSNSPRIKAIEIEGFRSIKKARVEFGDLNVLVGPNQSGKTTLLDALDFLAMLAGGHLSNALRYRGGLASILWAGENTSQLKFRVEISLTLSQEWVLIYEVVLVSASEGYRIKEEHLIDSGDFIYLNVTEGKGFLRKSTDTATQEVVALENLQEPAILQYRAPKEFEHFQFIRSCLMGVFVYPGFNSLPSWSIGASSLRAPQPLSQGGLLQRDGSNMINVLYSLRENPGRWQEFLAFVRSGFSYLKDISFPQDTNGKIGLWWHDSRFPEKGFPIGVLSEGTVRFLALAAAIFSPMSPTLTALEEPEAHLHPELLYRYVGLLEQASSERQILLTTHSDALLSYLTDPSVILIASNGEQGTRFVRPPKEDLDEWLKTYSLSQLRESGHLLAFAENQDAA